MVKCKNYEKKSITSHAINREKSTLQTLKERNFWVGDSFAFKDGVLAARLQYPGSSDTINSSFLIELKKQ